MYRLPYKLDLLTNRSLIISVERFQRRTLQNKQGRCVTITDFNYCSKESVYIWNYNYGRRLTNRSFPGKFTMNPENLFLMEPGVQGGRLLPSVAAVKRQC